MKPDHHKGSTDRSHDGVRVRHFLFATLLLLGCLAAVGIWFGLPFGSTSVPEPQTVTPANQASAAATKADLSGSAGQAVARIDSQRQTELAGLDNPEQDGWESEAFAQVAQRQLVRLG